MNAKLKVLETDPMWGKVPDQVKTWLEAIEDVDTAEYVLGEVEDLRANDFLERLGELYDDEMSDETDETEEVEGEEAAEKDDPSEGAKQPPARQPAYPETQKVFAVYTQKYQRTPAFGRLEPEIIKLLGALPDAQVAKLIRDLPPQLLLVNLTAAYANATAPAQPAQAQKPASASAAAPKEEKEGLFDRFRNIEMPEWAGDWRVWVGGIAVLLLILGLAWYFLGPMIGFSMPSFSSGGPSTVVPTPTPQTPPPTGGASGQPWYTQPATQATTARFPHPGTIPELFRHFQQYVPWLTFIGLGLILFLYFANERRRAGEPKDVNAVMYTLAVFIIVALFRKGLALGVGDALRGCCEVSYQPDPDVLMGIVGVGCLVSFFATGWLGKFDLTPTSVGLVQMGLILVALSPEKESPAFRLGIWCIIAGVAVHIVELLRAQGDPTKQGQERAGAITITVIALVLFYGFRELLIWAFIAGVKAMPPSNSLVIFLGRFVYTNAELLAFAIAGLAVLGFTSVAAGALLDQTKQLLTALPGTDFIGRFGVASADTRNNDVPILVNMALIALWALFGIGVV